MHAPRARRVVRWLIYLALDRSPFGMARLHEAGSLACLAVLQRLGEAPKER